MEDSHMPCPVVLFLSAVPCNMLYSKQVNIRKCFPEFCKPFHQTTIYNKVITNTPDLLPIRNTDKRLAYTVAGKGTICNANIKCGHQFKSQLLYF